MKNRVITKNGSGYVKIFLYAFIYLYVSAIQAFASTGSTSAIYTDKSVLTTGEDLFAYISNHFEFDRSDPTIKIGIFWSSDHPETNPAKDLYLYPQWYAYAGEYVSNLTTSNPIYWKTRAPLFLGTYELRFYRYDGIPRADLPTFGRFPFTVKASTAKPGDLSLDSTIYFPKESIIATIQGLSNAQIDEAGAWAGLFNKSDPIASFAIQAISVRDLNSGLRSFAAPAEDGQYEIRVFTNAGVGSDYLFGVLPFEVRTQNMGVLAIEKATFRPRERMHVLIDQLTASQVRSDSWVGLFAKDSASGADEPALKQILVKELGASKTWTLEAPEVFGLFEVRLYTKDGNGNWAVTRSGITVDYGDNDFTLKSKPSKKVLTLRKNKSIAVAVESFSNAENFTIDVTNLSSFRSTVRKIAAVSPLGIIKAKGKGRAKIVIKFKAKTITQNIKVI